MRRRLVATLTAALMAGVVTASPARAATHDVTVGDNFFDPERLEIAPGDTVRWTATRPGHKVRAEDGRFSFHPTRTLELGEQVSWTFHDEEFVRYRCTIHPGMRGVIKVGNPPAEPVPPGRTLIVPDQVSTISAAADSADPGTEILIRPGIYHEEVVVRTRGLVLRGLGEDPSEVVVDGGHALEVGMTVAAPGVRIANMTFTRYRRAGVSVDGASATVIADMVLHDNGLYGLDGRDPSGLALRAVRVAGHGIAGIAVRDCVTCGLRVEGAHIEANAAGVVGIDASGIVVRASQIRGNAVGIVLRGVAGSQVVGNVLRDNAATDVWVASMLSEPEPPTGAGVWIRGGADNLVASNAVTGHTYNIAVTGPEPAVRHRITDNSLGGAGYADLGWDGLGGGVCFSGNRGSGGAPTSDPPEAQTVGYCGAVATAGVPYPVVTANLAAHAAESGYPI